MHTHFVGFVILWFNYLGSSVEDTNSHWVVGLGDGAG